MAIPSLAVANYFIQKSIDTGVELTPMKLIKLVYIAHGWYLSNTGEPLINEAVQAWKFGPVIPTIYSNFRHYRDAQITRMGMMYLNGQVISPVVEDTRIASFLDKVWEAYSRYSGWQLSSITHELDTPWYKTWVDNSGHKIESAIIPNDVIEQHYRHLAEVRNGR